MKPGFLTPEQEAEFDGYVLKWQAILGLTDWRIERSSKSAGKGAMAQVTSKVGARLAVYQTGYFGPAVTPELLEATALHELLHVMLVDFAHGIKTNADELTLEGIEHSVINRLEKLLMKAPA